MPLAPGTRLGTYEVLAPLGAGGMGEVYRARDTRLGRAVALKVLPETVASSPERLARFEREARTVAGLNHPNIVTLFSVEDESGVRFLTMELVEGKTLDSHIVPTGLPLARVLDLALPLAGALAAAHERGVIHRDLKPGNVMVTRDGWVKVLDFGLAKMTHDEGDPGATIGATAEAPISGHGQVLGTVPYMAPEQIRGEAVDARADLFALGIILYELATGRRPFAGPTPADVSSAILRDAPVPVLTLRADLPRDLDRIVTRCLEKRPTDRFQTARDVHNELRYLQRDTQRDSSAAAWPSPAMPAPQPVPTPPPSRPVTPAPSSAARPPSSASAPPRDAPSIAVLPFVNRSRGEEDEYFSDGLADELLNVLTKVRGLRVAARASSFQFKGKNEDLAVIGEKLNVATLLDGSVRKAGNRVRISVQLIHASDRVQLWSETYDRAMDDIFAVQDDIAQCVVKELRSALLGEQPDSKASDLAHADVAAAAKGHGNNNPEAHRLYLQGKYLLDRLTPQDTKKGLEYLEQATALDPRHALAFTEISRAHATNGGYGWAGSVHEAYKRARTAALHALELEPDLAQAYVRLAGIQRMYDWDFRAAEESTRRALQLAPNLTAVIGSAASLAQAFNRLEEAESLYRRALEQDPLSAGLYGSLAMVYRCMGRLPEAERLLRQTLELAPDRVGGHLVLSIVLAEQGRYDEALQEAQREFADWARLTALAYVHQLAGREAEALEALRQLEEKHAVDASYQISAIHAVRGDRDRTFAWLERAYQERDTGLAVIAIEPIYRPLHDDPRWKPFLRKMGLAA